MVTKRMRMALWLACCVSSGAAGCLPDDEDSGEPSAPSCALPYDGADLEGAWTLRAEGRREGCEDRRLEGALSIVTEMPIEISTTLAADGSTSTRDAYALEVADTNGEGSASIELDGTTNGACLRVHVREELPDGDAIEYELDGFITAEGRAEGEITGTGPETCMITGRFAIDVQ